MNEIINVLIEHGAEFAIVDPLLKEAARGGIYLAKDWIGSERLNAIRDTFRRAEEKLKRKNIMPERPSLSVLVPLLEAAQDESNEELRELWSRLLAAASDPTRKNMYRREFVDIAKNMEPIDALVLPLLRDPGGMSPTRLAVISSRLSRSEDEVQLSFRNLENLELIDSKDATIAGAHRPKITALGRQFLLAVAE